LKNKLHVQENDLFIASFYYALANCPVEFAGVDPVDNNCSIIHSYEFNILGAVRKGRPQKIAKN